MYQHPAPRAPDDFREGARYRYVPRGERGGGTATRKRGPNEPKPKAPKAPKAFVVGTRGPGGPRAAPRGGGGDGPSESRRHALDVRVAAVGAPCARARCARRGAARRNRTMKQTRARNASDAALASSFAECGASPPPPGASDAAPPPRSPPRSPRPRPLRSRLATTTTTTTTMTTTMTAAIRWSLSSTSRSATVSEEGDEVVFVKETGPDADAAASNDTRRRRGGSDETGGDAFGSGSVAERPPPRCSPSSRTSRVRVRAASRGGERGDARQVRKDRVSGT